MRAFYFGTFERPGHYLRDASWKTINPENPHQGVDKIVWGPLPWKDIDGGLQPQCGGQGEALLHHKDGWTALAFANDTDDRRGGNSAFFFDAELDFDQALAAARERFPHVVERFAFEIVEL